MRHKFIIFSIVIFTFFKVKGQHYAFKNYSIEKGLAQSQVYTICQDQDNYLWIGTLGGVSKFDGKSFVNFYKEDGINDNSINRVFCDNLNRVWVGTKNGFSVINKGKIKQLKIKQGSTSDITDFYVKNSTVWISTAKQGVFKFTYEKDSLTFNSQFFNAKDRVAINRISQIKGIIYLATNRGLVKIENGVETKIKEIPNVKCTGVKEGINGELWVSTYDQGVFKISNNNVEVFNETKDRFKTNFIRNLFVDVKGNVWLASKRNITKISPEGEVKNFNYSNGFDFIAETIFQDSEGNIWVGTEGKGVVKFISEEFRFLKKENGLHSDLILSFCEDNNGKMWFSSYGEGIAQKTKDNYTSYFSRNSGLSNNTVWCSIKDSEGNLWFGTGDGLTKYKNGLLTSFNVLDGLPHQKVQSLYQDKNDTLWIGTKKGVVKFIDGKFIKEGGTKLRNVRSIHQDQKKCLWLGTSRGLYFKTPNGIIKKHVDSLMNSQTVYGIQSFNEKLWVATSSGLFFYNNNVFSKVSLTIKKGNSNSVNFLKIDSYNYLWAGTNNGVFTIDLNNFNKNNIQVKQYSINDGLVGLEANLNAVFEDSKQNIWIGTSEGVSVFKRNKLKGANQFVPKTNITGVKLFYETKNWLKDSLSTFSYNRNNFTFNYNSPYFYKPKEVKYSFILEGFNAEWSPASNTPFSIYSNLPHGTYVFKVKSSVDEKTWGKIKTYKFTITPPFWLTWWFRISFLILLFTLIYFLIKRQKSIVKEKQERELLTYKNKLVKLEQQSLNASMNRHFIFNALNSIQFYINKEDKLSANRYLSSFAKLIRKNLDSSSNENNLISLSDEIERLSLYLSLEKMRFKEKFDYVINIDESVNKEETMVPGMFLQPFIENSIWHGVLPSEKKGEIKLIVTAKNNKLQFLVTDNGIGISNSLKNKQNELKSHTSRGMVITANRIALLEKVTGKEITLDGPKDLIEKGEIKGTIVKIVFG